MTPARRQGILMLLLTFSVALLLAVMPLPAWAHSFRPQWPLLVLIYWAMALPQRVGIGYAWVLGIAVDLLTSSLLGMHAMIYAIIVFIIIQLHRQIRVFPLWQQAIGIFMLLLLEYLLKIWLLGFTKQVPTGESLWISPVISMLLWPWIYIILRDLRRRFNIS
jgi:rod shape-determining protein MreD